MRRTSATLMDLLCFATLSLQAGLAVAQQAPSDAQSPTQAEQEVIKANEELDDPTRRNDADALARIYADSRSCRLAFGPGVHSIEDSDEYEEEHFSSHRVLDHSGDPSERLLETSASPPSG